MKYLSDRIEFNFSITGTTLPSNGAYKYELYTYDSVMSEEVLAFVGNFYYNGKRNITFDLTDIIRSLKSNLSKDYFTNSTNYASITSMLISRFKVKVYFTSNSPIESNWEFVAMAYRYPNYINTNNFNNGNGIFFDVTTQTNNYSIALQGIVNTGSTLSLIPHYPLKDTSVYKFAQSFLFGANEQSILVSVGGGVYSDEFNINASYEDGTACILRINYMLDFRLSQNWGSNDIWLTEEGRGADIAIFDNCYKRYYLFWQDRFGGYQSQAFNDYATFSEAFEVTETQNYQNERKKSFIQIQPKWKLNSGWIDETVYPLYESIFVSPILLLYDAYEDRLHEVIVKADYTEKTYRSEKKLLNMNLELEAITKQDIVY